jgi:hypothetical protein
VLKEAIRDHGRGPANDGERLEPVACVLQNPNQLRDVYDAVPQHHLRDIEDSRKLKPCAEFAGMVEEGYVKRLQTSRVKYMEGIRGCPTADTLIAFKFDFPAL